MLTPLAVKTHTHKHTHTLPHTILSLWECVCMLCLCMQNAHELCICREARGQCIVILNCSPSHFWDRVTHWTWNLQVQPDWLGSKLSAFLCLSSTLKAIHWCLAFWHGNSGPLAYNDKHFAYWTIFLNPDIKFWLSPKLTTNIKLLTEALSIP